GWRLYSARITGAVISWFRRAWAPVFQGRGVRTPQRLDMFDIAREQAIANTSAGLMELFARTSHQLRLEELCVS
ncbi:MAG TPA: hypothetical protein VF783_02505, partial [Terriglobales bacterium]